MGSTSKKIPNVLDPAEWRAATPGIPDEYFERNDSVPITKEEVRAIQISKSKMYPGCSILDVGCGSGSVTVEAAIQAGHDGSVTAIDRDMAAIELTKTNLERFGIKNTSVIHGEATDVLKDIKGAKYDAVIIGGTGGATSDIARMCADMTRPGGRMVIGTILIETLHSVLKSIYDMPFSDVDITQVTISKSRKTSTGTMMLARNPVTIVSASRL